MSYGYAAFSNDANPRCCRCYQLDFTSGPVVGKSMIVQVNHLESLGIPWIQLKKPWNPLKSIAKHDRLEWFLIIKVSRLIAWFYSWHLPTQVTNTGSDLGSGQFDLQIPGGGVGIFTQGCPNQWGSWNGGAQYGGVSNRNECYNLPTQLQEGCFWRFDWFANADNPTMNYREVSCPRELTDRTNCFA